MAPKVFNSWPNIVKFKRAAQHIQRQTYKKPC